MTSNQLDLAGAARQLASHCVLIARERGVVRLALDPARPFVSTPRAGGETARRRCRVISARRVRLEFETDAPEALSPARADEAASLAAVDAPRAHRSSPIRAVQALRERFGATLFPDTVRPIK